MKLDAQGQVVEPCIDFQFARGYLNNLAKSWKITIFHPINNVK